MLPVLISVLHGRVVTVYIDIRNIAYTTYELSIDKKLGSFRLLYVLVTLSYYKPQYDSSLPDIIMQITETSCRRAAATICAAPLLPRGRRSASRRRADGNVAAVSHCQHVPTDAAAWRANTAN